MKNCPIQGKDFSQSLRNIDEVDWQIIEKATELGASMLHDSYIFSGKNAQARANELEAFIKSVTKTKEEQ